MISVDQCRAARALLDWTAQQLAERAQIGVATVRRYEAGAQIADTSLSAIEDALAGAGVTFIGDGEVSRAGGEGVRFSPPPQG
jgi:transcriptional regulator with XRE-family HTH domain